MQREREAQRHRQREKQAPRREPDVKLDPKSPGSGPGLKAGLNRGATRAAPDEFILNGSSLCKNRWSFQTMIITFLKILLALWEGTGVYPLEATDHREAVARKAYPASHMPCAVGLPTPAPGRGHFGLSLSTRDFNTCSPLPPPSACSISAGVL